jgi:tRNA1(Val) A37 N6-methylase TrmN6
LRTTGEEATTEDRLLGGQVVIRQPRDGFRVAIDTVLLAAAVAPAPGDMVLDAGSGCGAAALCLARRVPRCRIVGLERDAGLVALAAENIALNAAADRVEIRLGDVARPPASFGRGSFDHVMMNPPHLRADRARASPDPAKAAASLESDIGLEEWIGFAVAMLRPKGTLTVVHRADRLDDLLASLRGRAGGIVVVPLWPARDARPAKRVIVRARKGIVEPLVLAPGLVLHEADGRYTREADAVLRGAALAP